MQNPRMRTWLIWLGAVAAMASCTKAGVDAFERDRILTVRLSRESSERERQISTLARFDLSRIDREHGTAELVASSADKVLLATEGMSVVSDMPADSKKALADAQIEKYFSPDKVIESLKALAAAHPDIVTYRAIGKSRENREIGAVILTAPGSDEEKANRPALFFDAMHHSRELMTTEVVMDAATRIATRRHDTVLYSQSLQRFRLVFVPQVNPDGNVLVRTKDAFWRKNAFPLDGVIKGVDLNRNYPADWASCEGSSDKPDDATYRGPTAGSEPETQALMAFAREIGPAAAMSYHSTGGYVLLPSACSGVRNPDMSQFLELGTRIKDSIVDDSGRRGTYALGTTSSIMYSADGTSTEWFWKELGTLAIAIELNQNVGFLPNYDQWRNVTVERQVPGWEAVLQYAAERTFTISVGKDLLEKFVVAGCVQAPLREKQKLTEALVAGKSFTGLLSRSSLVCILSNRNAPTSDTTPDASAFSAVSVFPEDNGRRIEFTAADLVPVESVLPVFQ